MIFVGNEGTDIANNCGLLPIFLNEDKARYYSNENRSVIFYVQDHNYMTSVQGLFGGPWMSSKSLLLQLSPSSQSELINLCLPLMSGRAAFLPSLTKNTY